MSNREKWEGLERKEAEYEEGNLARGVLTAPVIVGLAAIAGGPITAAVAALGWGIGMVAGKHKRDREREGGE